LIQTCTIVFDPFAERGFQRVRETAITCQEVLEGEWYCGELWRAVIVNDNGTLKQHSNIFCGHKKLFDVDRIDIICAAACDCHLT
jgi:hypothetical protein